MEQAPVEKVAKTKRAPIEKNNTVLDKLDVVYVPVGLVTPNSYNPNRQSDHDFELLCRSIAEDGFTQPIVVLRSTNEIVDGEHRWRACKALGFEEVPVVYVDMSAEQMRISTLRHNRARGSEDASLAGEILRQIAEFGAIDMAADSLMMDEVEMSRMLRDMGTVEASQIEIDIPDSQLGPRGKGLAESDKQEGFDSSSDEFRAKQKLLDAAKKGEESRMSKEDANVYRLVLFFSAQEAVVVKRVLDQGEGAAQNILRICREEIATRSA